VTSGALGRLEASKEYYQQALQLGRDTNDRTLTVMTLQRIVRHPTVMADQHLTEHYVAMLRELNESSSKVYVYEKQMK
jgi:hypothetical protein